MIRIGITAAVRFEGKRGCHHGNAFSSMFNGWDKAKAEELDWPTGGASDIRIEGARVVKIYDEDREGAEMMAQIYGIDEVCDSPEELAEGVDAGLIADSGEFDKIRYAPPFLEKGLPLFVDKPLAEFADDAQGIVDLAAANDAPLISCSGYRWAEGADEMRAQLGELGTIELLQGLCGQGRYHVYAIHPVEFAYGILGPGTESVINVGAEDRDIIRLRRADGKQVLLTMFWREVIQGKMLFTLCGSEGWYSMDQMGPVYPRMMGEFVKMCETREMPISGEEMVEVIRVVEAARTSRELGGIEVSLT